VNRFQGGLVFKAYRLVYHSTLGLRVIKNRKKKYREDAEVAVGARVVVDRALLALLFTLR